MPVWKFSEIEITPSELEHPEATDVSFAFKGTDAESYLCQLDDGPQEECVSGYQVKRLSPGQHIFFVTGVYTDIIGSRHLLSHKALEMKNKTWEVVPRFRLSETLVEIEVTIPQSQTVNVPITTDSTPTLQCLVDQTESTLAPACNPMQGMTALEVTVKTLSGATAVEGNYTATLVVRDNSVAAGIISEQRLYVTVTVSPQVTISIVRVFVSREQTLNP